MGYSSLSGYGQTENLGLTSKKKREAKMWNMKDKIGDHAFLNFKSYRKYSTIFTWL